MRYPVDLKQMQIVFLFVCFTMFILELLFVFVSVGVHICRRHFLMSLHLRLHTSNLFYIIGWFCITVYYLVFTAEILADKKSI